MKILFVGLIALVGTSAWAEMPFPGVTGKSLILGVDECTARKFLDDKITETGINILDYPIAKSWVCRKDDKSPNGTGTDGEPCPYRQYMNSDEVTCFSNHATAFFPALCVGDPSVEQVPMTYEDAGKVIELRPRFSALHVLRKTAAGYRQDEDIPMDEKKCERSPEGFHTSLKKCKELYARYATGGAIFKNLPNSPRFGSIVAPIDTLAKVRQLLDSFNAVTDLAECKSAYPNLYLDRFWLPSKP